MRDTPCELHQCECTTLIVDKSHVIYRRQQVFDRKTTTGIAVKKLWAPPSGNFWVRAWFQDIDVIDITPH
jgi:hypothetical protein